MPIYEFYCPECHMVFNFFSRTINTEKIPPCPKCDRFELERQMSSFAVLRGVKEDQDDGVPDVDESKLEKAMTALASEAERINEDDPKQAAQLMRKLTHMTGMELGTGMEEALRRMEAGEDPEQIEAEMGDLLEEEDPLIFQGQKKSTSRKMPPRKDEKLYEL
jgi:putative FmdB family regulatory protein